MLLTYQRFVNQDAVTAQVHFTVTVNTQPTTTVILDVSNSITQDEVDRLDFAMYNDGWIRTTVFP